MRHSKNDEESASWLLVVGEALWPLVPLACRAVAAQPIAWSVHRTRLRVASTAVAPDPNPNISTWQYILPENLVEPHLFQRRTTSTRLRLFSGNYSRKNGCEELILKITCEDHRPEIPDIVPHKRDPTHADQETPPELKALLSDCWTPDLAKRHCSSHTVTAKQMWVVGLSSKVVKWFIVGDLTCCSCPILIRLPTHPPPMVPSSSTATASVLTGPHPINSSTKKQFI
ncbi:hypothetical protein Pelo_8295 [Pelomyxa schiedti]|nr:hypothetical protein Pelo_8295 [Pelomyxa schiedti]